MRLIGIGFLAFGILFAGIGLLIGYGARVFGGHSEVTTGTVVDYRTSRSDEGNTMYAPVVEYRPAGGGELLRHVPSSRTSWRAYDIGEEVGVRYRPGSPARASLDGGLGFAGWIFVGFDLVFGGPGGWMLVQPVLRKRTSDDLRQNGRRIMAKVTDIYYDTSLEVNGRSPFRIAAQWHDKSGNKVRVFESDAIWYDPIDFVKPGDEIGVYVDRQRAKRYVVDLSKLPALEE